METYRPILVLPVLSTVVERIVHQQLYDYLEKTKLLYRRQFGFRKGVVYAACSDTLFRIHQEKYG